MTGIDTDENTSDIREYRELVNGHIYLNNGSVYKMIDGELRVDYSGWYWNKVDIPYCEVIQMKFEE